MFAVYLHSYSGHRSGLIICKKKYKDHKLDTAQECDLVSGLKNKMYAIQLMEKKGINKK